MVRRLASRVGLDLVATNMPSNNLNTLYSSVLNLFFAQSPTCNECFRLSKRKSTVPRFLGSMSIAFVTGATDGIGLHTARQLAASGKFAKILIHGRDPVRVERAKESIQSASSSVQLETYLADFSELDQVKRMCADILDRHHAGKGLGPIINNAGVFSEQAVVTDDGFELTYQTNVLASHIITSMLHPIASGKIIHVASISAASCVDLEAYQTRAVNQRTPYSAHRAYSESKLLNVMQACAYAERLRGRLTVQSLDPGTVNTKMLQAGWGMCGIPVSSADNQFSLAMREGERETETETGGYYVNDRPARYPSPMCTESADLERLVEMLANHSQTAFA